MPMFLNEVEAATLYKVVKSALKNAIDRDLGSAAELADIVDTLRAGGPLTTANYATAIRHLRCAAEDTDDLAFHNACQALFLKLLAEESQTEQRHLLARTRPDGANSRCKS
jgi:hypothetical protein